MSITVLGPTAVDGDSSGLSHRDRVVLAALASTPGEVVSADRLADALWAESPPASWNKVLHGCVMRLRKRLGVASIETVPGQGYRLAVAPDDIDARRFERSLEKARDVLALGDPDRASYLLDQALALWHGDAFAELEGWDAARIESGRLAELRRDAEELSVEAALRAGRHREVLAAAQAMVAAAPLRERRWSLLALAQYQSGRQGDALRTLHQVRTILVSELGLDPGPDLVALEQAILRQDPSLIVDVGLPAPSVTCPYRGLSPYDVGDSDTYFGRDADVAAARKRLAATGVAAVVGPSGSGKSSLVRAGLASTLGRDGTSVVVMTPGAHPAIPSGIGPATVLVVDQCEEVFALCADESERLEFLDDLVAQAEAGGLVLALRADRMGDVSSHAGFARVVERGLYVLAPMSPDDIGLAIEGPARQAGLVIEPGLVDLLVHEIEGETAALPQLSHALRETWRRREGRTLTVAGYRATGGISGAVAKSAEAVYSSVDPERQTSLRAVLLRLVTPGSESVPVRTRLPRRLVVTDPHDEELLETLVEARLVVSDDGVVELAHEVLVRAWPRLQDWLEADLEGQRILHHLAIAADSWDTLGRPESEVYRGVRLAAATAWRTSTEPHLTATERDFLAASQELATREQRAAERQAREQVTVNRRLRGLLAGVAVLLIAALIAALFAVRQGDRASTAANQADARRLGAQSLVVDDIDESMLLAVEGVKHDESRETRASLLAALAKRPQLVRSVEGRGTGFDGLSVSPNGKTVALHDSSDHIWLYDARTSQKIASYDLRTGGIPEVDTLHGPLAFSPDGTRIAAGAHDYDAAPIRLLDSKLRPARVQLGGFPGSPKVWDLAYSGDGRLLAATLGVRSSPQANPTTVVYVWSLDHPSSPMVRIATGDGLRQPVELSRDGRVLYVGTYSSPSERGVRIYDLRSRHLRTEREVGELVDLDVMPGGRTLAAVVAHDPDVILLDARTGRVVRRLHGHTQVPDAVRFSADGALLLSSSEDNTAIVWSTGTWTQRANLPIAEFAADGVGLSPDGATAYTAGYERSLRTWDLDGRRSYIINMPIKHPWANGYGFVNPSPSGDAIAYTHSESVTFVDLRAGRVARTIDVGNGWGNDSIAWDPDGKTYATGFGGVINLWDVRTGKVVRTPKRTGEDINELSYSADGKRIVRGGRDGTVQSLDSTTLERVGKIVDVGFSVGTMSAGPDGHSAIAFSGGPSEGDKEDFGRPNLWSLVDFSTGRVIRKGTAPFASVSWSGFSPDGRHAFANGLNGELVVLDLDTGRPVRPPVRNHQGVSLFATYNRDGSRILSGGGDGVASLWDGRTGELLGAVKVPKGDLVAPGFLPDGHSVLIADWFDGKVYRWDTRTSHAIAYACQIAGRNLTKAEWATTMGDEPYRKTCPNR